MQSILTSPTGKLSLKHLPAATFPFITQRLLLLVTSFCRLSVSVSSFLSSYFIPQSFSPPFLVSSPPVLLSEQLLRTSLLKEGPTQKHGSYPSAPRPALLFSSYSLHFMAAGSHILTSKSAWLRICICTRRTHSAHRKLDRQTCRGRHRNIYTWMHTHTDRRVYTDISTHTYI